MEQKTLSLPVQISTKVDVGRLLRELENLDNFLTQSSIRQAATPATLPKLSKLLDEFIQANKLNPLHRDERQLMIKYISQIRDKSPVIHMSFGADPSPVFLQKLTAWLRENIHPLVLLHVGLQPNIGAGCVVRTTNKHFDFSLRQHFKKQRQMLIDKIHEGSTDAVKPKAPVMAASPEVSQ